MEQSPGFFEADTVAHCGPTLKGEFIRTVNMTCAHTGWVFTRSIRNNAHAHIRAVFEAALKQVPFEVVGMDVDNGSEFINHALINWANERNIYFTRSRPYRKNDQAMIESKNNHLVRRYSHYWRYDTPTELELLNQLWVLVNDRLNYLVPTTKPTGWATTATGRRKRLHDAPATPFDRLLDSGTLTPDTTSRLTRHRATLNPARIERDIQRLQHQLTRLAARKNPT